MVLGLLVFACLVSLVGGVMMLVAAFRESALWGLAVMFIPFASFVFLFLHWDRAKTPFLVSLAGAGLAFGAMLGGGLTAGLEETESVDLDTMAAEEVAVEEDPYEPSDFSADDYARAREADGGSAGLDQYGNETAAPSRELNGMVRGVGRAENVSDQAEQTTQDGWVLASEE